MKKFKQMSTFWQMSILTFLAIISVIIIIITAQLLVVRIWTVKYEKDDIETKYNEISMLINANTNITYDKLFETMDLEAIIYDEDKNIIYNNVDDVPRSLEFDNPYRIKSRIFLNLDHDNVILNAP